MAQITGEIERDGRIILLYDNGLERDKLTGKIVRPADGAIIRDQARANELHKIRADKKREAVIRAANEAIDNDQLVTKYGDAAFVAAIIGASMRKATNPKDPRQVEAGRFVIEQAGLGEKTATNEGDPPPAGYGPAIREAIIELSRLITWARGAPGEVIEGSITHDNNDKHTSSTMATTTTDRGPAVTEAGGSEAGQVGQGAGDVLPLSLSAGWGPLADENSTPENMQKSDDSATSS